MGGNDKGSGTVGRVLRVSCGVEDGVHAAAAAAADADGAGDGQVIGGTGRGGGVYDVRHRGLHQIDLYERVGGVGAGSDGECAGAS